MHNNNLNANEKKKIYNRNDNGKKGNSSYNDVVPNNNDQKWITHISFLVLLI